MQFSPRRSRPKGIRLAGGDAVVPVSCASWASAASRQASPGVGLSGQVAGVILPSFDHGRNGGPDGFGKLGPCPDQVGQFGGVLGDFCGKSAKQSGKTPFGCIVKFLRRKWLQIVCWGFKIP